MTFIEELNRSRAELHDCWVGMGQMPTQPCLFELLAVLHGFLRVANQTGCLDELLPDAKALATELLAKRSGDGYAFDFVKLPCCTEAAAKHAGILLPRPVLTVDDIIKIHSAGLADPDEARARLANYLLHLCAAGDSLSERPFVAQEIVEVLLAHEGLLPVLDVLPVLMDSAEAVYRAAVRRANGLPELATYCGPAGCPESSPAVLAQSTSVAGAPLDSPFPVTTSTPVASTQVATTATDVAKQPVSSSPPRKPRLGWLHKEAPSGTDWLCEAPVKSYSLNELSMAVPTRGKEPNLRRLKSFDEAGDIWLTREKDGRYALYFRNAGDRESGLKQLLKYRKRPKQTKKAP